LLQTPWCGYLVISCCFCCHNYTFVAIVDYGVLINVVDVVFEADINVIVAVVVVSFVLVDYSVFVVDIVVGDGFVVLC